MLVIEQSRLWAAASCSHSPDPCSRSLPHRNSCLARAGASAGGIDAGQEFLWPRMEVRVRPSTFNSTWPYGPGPYRGDGEDVTVETCSRLCDEGLVTEAVAALAVLVQSGTRVSSSTFYSALKGCLAKKNLVLGQRVHALAVKAGHQSNTFLANQILRMYASQGRLQEAMQVFAQVAFPDTFIWCSIISAHTVHGEAAQAVKLYKQMRQSPLKPNSYVFVAALNACATAVDLDSGVQVHAEIMEARITLDIFLGNCLVDMYAKCGSLKDARRVFDSLFTKDVVTWNSMITGYAKPGLGHEALALYARMEQENIVLPNCVTFAGLLKACASIGAIQQGKQLHSVIVERGLNGDVLVGTCLVDMYAKCGDLEVARRVFDNLPTKNLVTWNSMINGYTEHGLCQETLALYRQMERDCLVVPDRLTFACLLKACASVGAIQQGKHLHSQILQRKLEADVVVGSCLVDMYAKCGSMEDAHKVFDRLSVKDAISWTAMLDGLGQCNEGQQAVQCFQGMLQDGVQPDETTFVCLLGACSHDGLVNEGRRYFNAMLEEYGVVPTRQHHVCMVDLLGRSGHLDEAENILLSMPFESDIVGWTSLLNSCKSHGAMDCGRRCFENLVRLDPHNAAAYVVMANMYADSGRWIDVDRIERLRKSAGAKKKPGKATIEVERQVHTFVVGEGRDDTSFKSRELNALLKEGGHVPHTELVLKPLSQNEKEADLCGHAEKLALAYGLLNTPDGTSLLVTKNLRMCGDCHSATQIMSRIERREIVVRDAHRVHRFVEGSCSCGNRP